jgi:3-oxoacyl-[acyl-carrier protein] reductase
MSQKPVLVPTASLHGKVAIVTGSSRGIGRGIALELASRGCSVVINYANSKGGADETVKAIEAFGNGARAVSIQADVTKVRDNHQPFFRVKRAKHRKRLPRLSVCSKKAKSTLGKLILS